MTADSKVESKVPQSCAEFALYTTLKIHDLANLFHLLSSCVSFFFAFQPSEQNFALVGFWPRILGVLTALYFFLFGLDLMGGSFGALGGKRAGQLFTITDNPIAGGGSLPMFTRSNILATIFVVGCA